MAISLAKGGNISLAKTAPGMTRVQMGLSWDARTTDGQPFDLDASIFLLSGSGKVRSDADFIFYNQPKSADGAVEHCGDNRTGVGEGDDEVVKVNLPAVAPDVQKLVFCVTIHEADVRRQNFGMVSNAAIRVVNQENNSEIARYDLSEDYSLETAMVFGELYRHPDGWKFKAVGQGFTGGLLALAKTYGVNL